jgi:hypothetical protein
MQPTMLRLAILSFLMSGGLLAAGDSAKADKDAVQTFALTSENVRKTTEVLRVANGKIKADPKIAQRIRQRTKAADASSGDTGDEADFARMGSTMEGEPVLRQALDKAGISGRDFALTLGALVYAQLGLMAQQSSGGKPVAGVNQANVTWLQKHLPEVRRFGEQMKENQGLMEKAPARPRTSGATDGEPEKDQEDKDR